MNKLTNFPTAGVNVLDPTNTTSFVTPADLDYKLSRDARAGLPGGVRLVGDGGGAAGFGYPVSLNTPAEFFAVFVVKPRWLLSSAWSILFTATDGTYPVVFSFGGVTGADMSGPALVSMYDQTLAIQTNATTGKTLQQLLDGGPCVVAFYRDASGAVTPYFNGTALPWDGTPTPPRLGNIRRMFGGVFAGYGQFTGDVILSRIANFAMTSAEALGASREESVGRLANRARAASLGVLGDGGGLPAFTSKSLVGTTVTLALDAGANYASALFYDATQMYKKGEIVRARGNVTAFSSPEPVNIWSEGVGNVGMELIGLTSTGAFDVTFAMPLDSMTPMGIRTYPFGAGAVNITIENLTFTVIGTVESYTPKNVRKGGGWRGICGNHLYAIGGGTALAPAAPQTRTTRYYLDFAGAGAATSLDDECPLVITFPSTSEAHIAWPAWFTAEVKASTVISANSAATGQGAFQIDTVCDAGTYCTVALYAASKKIFIDFVYTE